MLQDVASRDPASQLKGFLQLLQTSNLTVPLLEHGFVHVLHTLLKMVIKPDVLDQANSSLK